MSEPASATETATLGGGCFWCIEAVLAEVAGVRRVTSGYAGGHDPNPTYERVCRGDTGHAEVVQVEFDPQVLPYRDLLRIFLTVHDPTTKDRQGADVGPQYRSIVLTHDEAQAAAAREVLAEVDEAGVWDAPIVTEVAPLEAFHPAEGYHQNFYANNPEQGYCRVVIEPKVRKFRQQFAERAAARS